MISNHKIECYLDVLDISKVVTIITRMWLCRDDGNPRSEDSRIDYCWINDAGTTSLCCLTLDSMHCMMHFLDASCAICKGTLKEHGLRHARE